MYCTVILSEGVFWNQKSAKMVKLRNRLIWKQLDLPCSFFSLSLSFKNNLSFSSLNAFLNSIRSEVMSSGFSTFCFFVGGCVCSTCESARGLFCACCWGFGWAFDGGLELAWVFVVALGAGLVLILASGTCTKIHVFRTCSRTSEFEAGWMLGVKGQWVQRSRRLWVTLGARPGPLTRVRHLCSTVRRTTESRRLLSP